MGEIADPRLADGTDRDSFGVALLPREPTLNILLSTLLFAVVATAAVADEFVVTDVVLVDPVARELRPAEIHIVDGLIRGVAVPGEARVAEDVDRWSAAGRFALPAMLDASTFSSTQVSPGHRDTLGPEDARSIFLSFGVHRFVDLSGGIGSLRGGPVLTAPGGVGADIPGAVELADAEQARATVRGLVEGPNRPHRLSVIFDRGRQRRGMPVPVLEAILEQAGPVPVGVYVGTWRDVDEALEAGADWLVQIPPGLPPEPVLERVRVARPTWTPTVAVGMDFMALMAESGLRDSEALARALPEEMRTDYGEVRIPQSRLTESRLQNTDRLAALAALHQAGATLVAGSQSGGLGTAHGFTFVRELEAWGQAGVNAWEVLAGATLHGAVRLGIEAGLRAGARADFSLYAESPLDDLGRLADPDFVFVGGRREVPRSLASRASHSLVEDIPANPLPGGNRWSLLIIAVVGFAALLGLRQVIKRAAANALDS